MLINTTHEANQGGTRRLLERYEPTQGARNVWTVAGACVKATKINNRHGVPDDAETWTYEIWLPDEGWAYTVRAVWRCGSLFPPTPTHTVIIDYQIKDSTLVTSQEAVELAVNDWLTSASWIS